MGRRTRGGQGGPPAALPSAGPGEASAGDRVRFKRRHQHRGTWYSAGDEITVGVEERLLLEHFDAIEAS